MRAIVILSLLSSSVILTGCSGEAGVIDLAGDDTVNPFLEDPNQGKMDSHYFNPDGIEIEVDVQGTVEAPAGRRGLAPAMVAQYAMTHLHRQGVLYLESLAEDASAPERVEWLVDGVWLPAVKVDTDSLDDAAQFRIRGINAVLLHQHTEFGEVGRTLNVPVPLRPYNLMADAGDTCAKPDGHMTLSNSIYWYLWDPTRSECTMETEDLLLTVSSVLPRADSYPEYDQLVADNKVTAVILFGQIGDTMDEWDPGFRNLGRMARNLERAGYSEVEAPLGQRFAKDVQGVTIEIDLYSPKEFSGLSDHANFGNFERAIAEHEVVAYDGHSMLGASDFWARPTYPDFYQVFLYGGCLGYEYYVAPIVQAKGGWGAVDIVSSVIEVSADANYYAGPFFSKLEKAIEQDYRVSWKEILGAVRTSVGDSTFGASGVRGNCFDPEGDRCALDIE
ncbi:MAG: hypothetical protein ACI9WU_003838 [Myxococcota bacterium]|jgi:hypothetical protein